MKILKKKLLKILDGKARNDYDILRNKIGKIIEEEFDSRMGNAVISYIMDKGMSNVKEITDEQIDKLEGNGFLFSLWLDVQDGYVMNVNGLN